MNNDREFYLNYVTDMIVYDAMLNSDSCNWIVTQKEIKHKYQINDREFDIVVNTLKSKDQILDCTYDENLKEIDYIIGFMYNIDYDDVYNEFSDYITLKKIYTDTLYDKDFYERTYVDNNNHKFVNFKSNIANTEYTAEYYNDQHLMFLRECFLCDTVNKIENIIDIYYDLKLIFEKDRRRDDKYISGTIEAEIDNYLSSEEEVDEYEKKSVREKDDEFEIER